MSDCSKMFSAAAAAAAAVTTVDVVGIELNLLFSR